MICSASYQKHLVAPRNIAAISSWKYHLYRRGRWHRKMILKPNSFIIMVICRIYWALALDSRPLAIIDCLMVIIYHRAQRSITARFMPYQKVASIISSISLRRAVGAASLSHNRRPRLADSSSADDSLLMRRAVIIASATRRNDIS